MGFLAKGKEKEKEFLIDYKHKYLDAVIIEATKKEDIEEHFDYIINGKKFDIKGLKKVSREDTNFNENYHWVELKNVNNNLGWLYGNADYFVFELNEYWLVVEKIKLQKLIASKVNKKIRATSQDEALYCIYTRDNRMDMITLIKTIDLMVIVDDIIYKRQENSIQHKHGYSIIPRKFEKQRIKNLFKK